MGRHAHAGSAAAGVQHKLRKGLWSPGEDDKLYSHIIRYGVGCWSSVPKLAGLQRCGKSCRLRWINYLCPCTIPPAFPSPSSRSVRQLSPLAYSFPADYF